MTDTADTDIEAILSERFPSLPLIELARQIDTLGKSGDAISSMAKKMAEVDALRAELRALGPEELRARARESRARVEAAAAAQRRAKEQATEQARFYNRADAAADFGLWLKVDAWTADEAAALLLGRDPRVVNLDSLERELTEPVGLLGMGKRPGRSAFHAEFDRLRLILSRADALDGHRLRPAALAKWAQESGVKAPEPMQSLLTDTPTKSTGPKKRKASEPWTADELRSLAAYRKKHGTKAAAAQFDISQQRIRELLPQKAKAPSPFPTVTAHKLK